MLKAVSQPSSLPPSGPAGGDLSGTYPNPTVASIGGDAVSLGGAFTTSGAFPLTLTTTGTTNVTLPTTGTLTTLATVLSTANAYTAQQNFSPPATLTSSSNSIAWNLTPGQVAVHTATENTTLANPTNMVNGGTYILRFIQDSTPRTLAFGNAYKWSDGDIPVVSTGSGAVDIFSFYSDGSNMYGRMSPNFI